MPGPTSGHEAGWMIGLMSGTSGDGVDAALLWTDGEGDLRPGVSFSEAYDPAFRSRLMACYGGKGPVVEIERELTERHGECVHRLLTRSGREPSEIVAIGFHGQTILHAPERGLTWQLGDGPLLARLTGIDVVNDFRSADVAAGGQGAPLVPVFHRALAGDLARPVAFLNIGGVANVTWVGVGAEMLAFDTGPGNALIDDWAMRHAGIPRDHDGVLASQGRVVEARLRSLLDHPYFAAPAPKSLDRDSFRQRADSLLSDLSAVDGAATLTAATAASVAIARQMFPAPAREWIVCGGGRRNPVLMRELAQRLDAPLRNVDELGWDGDTLEAMAFAYLALRSIKGMPLSLPGTTGVPRPQTGGRTNRAPRGQSSGGNLDQPVNAVRK